MTPQSDQVSRQRAIEAAIEIARDGLLLRPGVGTFTQHVDIIMDVLEDRIRAALALPSETPVGHQIREVGFVSKRLKKDGSATIGPELFQGEDYPPLEPHTMLYALGYQTGRDGRESGVVGE